MASLNWQPSLVGILYHKITSLVFYMFIYNMMYNAIWFFGWVTCNVKHLSSWHFAKQSHPLGGPLFKGHQGLGCPASTIEGLPTSSLHVLKRSFHMRYKVAHDKCAAWHVTHFQRKIILLCRNTEPSTVLGIIILQCILTYFCVGGCIVWSALESHLRTCEGSQSHGSSALSAVKCIVLIDIKYKFHELMVIISPISVGHSNFMLNPC